MVTAWKEYCSVNTPLHLALAGEIGRAQAFAPLRDAIAEVALGLRPKTVACLGAGLLNDIPYWDLVRSGAEITLVDWLPALVEHGLAHSQIQWDENDDPDCAYCALDPVTTRAYCRNFKNPVSPGDSGVCAHYRQDSSGRPVCSAYERGTKPCVLDADVTQGFATAFADRVFEEIDGLTSWRQALKVAANLTRQLKANRSVLDLADASMDFVTSSMLASQFEHEPYDYFSRQVMEHLGPPAAREERRLSAPLEKVRSALFAAQFERHCDEIRRILRPRGRCFMAIELFHKGSADDWFLVREMHDALAAITGPLAFDFDLLPPERCMIRVAPNDRPTMVLCLILKPAD